MNMQNDSQPFITVFTPSYNRAHTLPRTYQSLVEQDCKEFIWLIIDDGSTDSTRKLVDQWICENPGFSIQYIYKNNGGMHTAHNTAYEAINTELNVCIDSDDMLAPGAIRLIKEKWDKVRKDNYAGIIGLDADYQGRIIGKGFPDSLTETSVMDYYRKGGSGDKKLVYRTDIIKNYPPYPVFKGEKYVSLAYKYRLIDQTYKMAVLDEILCMVEYQEDGSSNSMLWHYRNNPKGFAFWRKIRMEYPDNPKRLYVDSIHYVSSSLLGHNFRFIKEYTKKICTICAIPPGVLLTLYILFRTRN